MERSTTSPYYQVCRLIANTQQEETRKIAALQNLQKEVDSKRLMSFYLSVCFKDGESEKKANMEKILRFAEHLKQNNENNRMLDLLEETIFELRKTEEGKAKIRINSHFVKKYGKIGELLVGRPLKNIKEMKAVVDQIIEKSEVTGIFFYRGKLKNPTIGFFTSASKIIGQAGRKDWVWIAKKKENIVRCASLPQSPMELIRESAYNKVFANFIRIS